MDYRYADMLMGSVNGTESCVDLAGSIGGQVDLSTLVADFRLNVLD
jgi:hypothetical protein